jgi:hypothetical protein
MSNCPSCSYPLEAEARCCVKCGAELPAAAATESAVPASELSPELQAFADYSRDGLIDDVIPARSASRSTVSSASRVSQCEDLHIQYNTARIFVEGMILPFDFKITPRVDEITDICIEIRCSDYARVSDEPPEEPTKDFIMPVHLAFRAPKGLPGGLLPFEIYVGYRKAGKQAWFVTRQVHTVHAAGENAGRAIENVQIEIQNHIEQGHATDLHLNQDMSEYLAQLKANHLDTSVEQLARIDLPEVWTTLTMIRCRKQSWQERIFPPSRQSTPPTEACRTRLTLRREQVKWHLLSETSLVLGMHRTSDIVTRFRGNLFSLSKFISRSHCRIERTGTSWRVLDGNYNTNLRSLKPSLRGTFLDGRPLDVDEGAELVPGQMHTITLGPSESGSYPPFQLDLDVLAWEDIRTDERMLLDESGRYAQTPPALIIRSPFIPDEIFVLLWHILPLRRLDSRLHSLCCVRRTEAYQLCGAGCDCTWLTPGENVHLLKQSFAVSDYDQTIPRKSKH